MFVKENPDRKKKKKKKEPRDTRHIYRQSANLKKGKKANKSHCHLQGELESIINFQRGEKEFALVIVFMFSWALIFN